MDALEKITKGRGAPNEGTFENIDPERALAVAQEQMLDLIVVDRHRDEIRPLQQVDTIVARCYEALHSGLYDGRVDGGAPDGARLRGAEVRILELLKAVIAWVRGRRTRGRAVSLPGMAIGCGPT